MFWSRGTQRSNMIFNTGLGQMPAVPTYAAYVVTAGIWPNPVKYFTDKKCRALAKISQNPASNALQVLELVYTVTAATEL